MISMVLVVVDMGFTGGGGLTGGRGGRTVGGCWTGGAVVNIVVADVTEGFRVVKGVTGGKGFIMGVMV